MTVSGTDERAGRDDYYRTTEKAGLAILKNVTDRAVIAVSPSRTRAACCLEITWLLASHYTILSYYTHKPASQVGEESQLSDPRWVGEEGSVGKLLLGKEGYDKHGGRPPAKEVGSNGFFRRADFLALLAILAASNPSVSWLRLRALHVEIIDTRSVYDRRRFGMAARKALQTDFEGETAKIVELLKLEAK
ncbi:hypothetical protein CAPTEDRAFT_189808 [Capitella teleta]|uniref:Uncharacterized protein n=1 Tax=Capitella teleta TaxID=283909 RepID=R7UMR4_CAPTE|nr:hypothetical protein CAPTEDRAFT_189808 [Capitella teleta]|eukprot:ELU04542.1 hypothetical protein CAPTEDRAFT_189808 [Capitella teleta]